MHKQTHARPLLEDKQTHARPLLVKLTDTLPYYPFLATTRKNNINNNFILK